MEILLVAIHIEKSPRAVPMGPAMLSAFLKKDIGDKVKTEILDLYLEQDAETCAAEIMKINPKYIGFSLYVWNREKTLEIAEILKKENKEIVIFTGGAEATADFDVIIKNENIDFIIPGEGEYVIAEAVEYILAGRDINKIQEELKANQPMRLEELPSPYLDGTLDIKKYSGILWELSRGCPFKCAFCYESRGTDTVRRFPMDRIKKELQLFEENKVDQIFILDPTFNFNVKKAKEILRFIIETAPCIHYSFEIRCEFLDEEMAELFSQINCSIQIGIQSANPEVLKNIDRRINLNNFAEKILFLHERGIVYGFDLIYGLPGDSLEGFIDSYDFTLSMRPNHVDIFNLAVLPSTKLQEEAESYGIKYLSENPYTVINTPTFSENDMKEANRIATSHDHFYNKGKAVPWFQLILDYLEVEPSEFIMEFNAWLDSESIDLVAEVKKEESSIISIQRRFLEHVFATEDENTISLIISDIVACFGYTESLFEKTSQVADDAKYFLNPKSFFVEFYHNPNKLMNEIESGNLDFDLLAANMTPNKREYLIFAAEDSMDIKSFSKGKTSVLKKLVNGVTDLKEFGNYEEFISECIKEGIIIGN